MASSSIMLLGVSVQKNSSGCQGFSIQMLVGDITVVQFPDWIPRRHPRNL